jgi:hypothetical protein
MSLRIGRFSFAIVVIGVLAATLFRVSTAPERIKQRRDTAQATCIANAGTWKTVGRTETCERP